MVMLQTLTEATVKPLGRQNSSQWSLVTMPKSQCWLTVYSPLVWPKICHYEWLYTTVTVQRYYSLSTRSTTTDYCTRHTTGG